MDYKDEWPTQEGWRTEEYDGRCGNCYEAFKKGDKYCRYCGTKCGEGSGEAYSDFVPVLYDVIPVKRVRKCAECGNEWTSIDMLHSEKYCSDCGKLAQIIEEERWTVLPKEEKKKDTEWEETDW